MLLTDRFRTAQRDPELAVLESFHAVKHVLRLGACVWMAAAAQAAGVLTSVAVILYAWRLAADLDS